MKRIIIACIAGLAALAALTTTIYMTQSPKMSAPQISTETKIGTTGVGSLLENPSIAPKSFAKLLQEGDETVEVLLDNVQFVAESLPVVNIVIDESQGTIEDMNSDREHNTRCYGDLEVLLNDGTITSYEMEYIKGRGNSTWVPGYKVPYKIKLYEKADLFGMGENKHWVLIANAMDRDLTRNALTYSLAKELGIDYAIDYVTVDVVMNGEYLGNYLLCENVRVGKNRIEIDDLDGVEGEENITGGYLLGMSYAGADEDSYTFETEHHIQFNVNSPEPSDDPKFQEEMEYIATYMQRIENALYGDPDPITGQVEDPFTFMSLESTVAYFWIQELSYNTDAFHTGSTYLFKQKDGKLYWGPIWDFDIAWQKEELHQDIWLKNSEWFRRLLTNEIFCNAMVEYYENTLRPVMEKYLAEDGFLENYYDTIACSAVNNGAVWGFRTSDTEYDYTYDLSEIRTLFEISHTELMDAIRHRVSWCGENLDTLKMDNIKVLFQIDGETISSTNVNLGAEINTLPESPSQDGKFFAGWYWKETTDKDTEESPFEKYSIVSSDYVEEFDGETCAIVYAVFEDRDPAKEIQDIVFEQDSYDLYLEENSYSFWLDIEFDAIPCAYYSNEIKWTSGDESIVEVEAASGAVEVLPKQEGTTTITGTLRNGKTIAITVNIVRADVHFSSLGQGEDDFGDAFDEENGFSFD